jgi:hypothetical protein
MFFSSDPVSSMLPSHISTKTAIPITGERFIKLLDTQYNILKGKLEGG